MAMLSSFGSAVHTFAGVASPLPPGQARGAAEMEPLVQGAHKALAVYSRASDAYAADLLSPAFWALLIAALLVLVEWLVSRHRGGGGR